jgi:phage terminase small subunit
MAIANRQAAEMRKWASELGFTSSSQSRQTATEADDSDPFDQHRRA